jgi:predicted nucleotidyltransferase component of viral defense system
MVTRAELVSIARKQKLPLGMIEKDFVLTMILREICNSRFRHTLVFKGGTALHKLYLDMWLLLKELEFKDFEKLAEKKLAAMNDNIDISRIFSDLDIVKSLWKVDLEQLIPELPDFDSVMNELRRKLES